MHRTNKKEQGGFNDGTFIQENIISFLTDLKSKNGKNIWLVGGGELLSTFIKEKLLDEVIITVAPRLVGEGVPLFKNNDFQTSLTLKYINRFNQFVELHYEVVK